MKEQRPTSGFRLSELATAAGVAGKTIHFYLREGILPPARKVREKLALYGDNHLRLLKLVQKLQKERHLPLGFIGQLFRQAHYDAEALELNLVAGMYDRVAEGQGFLPGSVPSAPAVAELSIAPGLQTELAKLGLVGSASGPLTGEERRIAWCVKSAQEKGLPPASFAQLLGPIQAIVSRQTMATLNAIDGDASFRQAAEQAGEIDRLFNHFIEAAKTRLLRLHFEKSFEEGPLSVRKLRERIYIPSPAFLKKHDIPAQLDALEARVNRQRPDHRLRLLLAEAYLAIGRYEEAGTEARKVLRHDKQDASALIAQATANGLLGRTDEAVGAAERAYRLRPDDPRAAAYCAMVYLIQAARVGGIVSPVQWLKKSLALFQKSLELPVRRTKDRLELLFIKGRAYTILPAPLEKVDEGIAALTELLSIVDSRDEKSLGLPFQGFNAVYRLNTHYFLGSAYALKNDSARAQTAWQQVLLHDPESAFGKKAFRHLQVRN